MTELTILKCTVQWHLLRSHIVQLPQTYLFLITEFGYFPCLLVLNTVHFTMCGFSRERMSKMESLN